MLIIYHISYFYLFISIKTINNATLNFVMLIYFGICAMHDAAIFIFIIYAALMIADGDDYYIITMICLFAMTMRYYFLG
jgi:hypothetical protein